MLGTLTNKEMDDLLSRQVTGRLGCHDRGRTYVVPVNYVYRKGAIYAHSGPGKKIEMMRRRPKVCFEVDDIESIFKWQSVIAWGEFEELTDIAEKEEAMQALTHRIMPFVISPSGHPSHGITESEYDVGTRIDVVVYRIRITSKTGRFEKP